MPEFTDEERDLARGAYDFYGVNHYTAVLVSATNNLGNNAVPSILDDINTGTVSPSEWPVAASFWLRVS